MPQSDHPVADRKYLTIIRFEMLSNGDSVYFAFHPELPGCMTDGPSPEEARRNLEEARMMYLDHLRENGLPIPEPMLFLGSTVPPPTVRQQFLEDQLQCEPDAEFAFA